jgi:hypothetical protein
VEDWRDRLAAAVQACMPAGHDNYSAFVLRCSTALSSDEDTIPPGTRAAWNPESGGESATSTRDS